MDRLLVNEKRLWFALDQIATQEATIGGSLVRRESAEAMMGYLEAPSPQECHAMWLEVQDR